MKEKSPRFINIVAQNNGFCKNPCINGTLDRTLNAYEIAIFDGKKMNNFYIFFSPTKSMRVNQAVRSLTKVTYWTGDILIMRAGVRAKGVVNMRGHDAKLADFALKR
jgi:hypothetical protein